MVVVTASTVLVTISSYAPSELCIRTCKHEQIWAINLSQMTACCSGKGQDRRRERQFSSNLRSSLCTDSAVRLCQALRRTCRETVELGI